MDEGCKSLRLRLGISCLTLIGIPLLSFAPDAQARVTKLTITTTEAPTFKTTAAPGGASFGAVGQYERIEGIFTGEVDPKDPLNAVIVDIELAPRNANGTVSYSADFQILRPINLAKGNHRVLFELPNRGGTNALSLLNDSKTNNTTATAGDPGNGFLMNQGYTIVEGSWDTTVAQGGAGFGVTFPVAKNRDGSTITGPATEELVVDKNATQSTLPLTYAAVSADKSKASLTVRENFGDAPQLVPSSGWDYTDSSLTAVKLTSGKFGGPGSFGPTALYEFTYVAQNPVVVGLGFAALRDLGTFLRSAKQDDGGVANPLAGDVQRIYTFCSSQPCRTVNDFVLWGFNEAEQNDEMGDEHGHGGNGMDGDHGKDGHAMAFDGVLNWKAGGNGIFMNYRFSQPTRTHRQHIARWTPEFQFPFANEKFHDPVTGQTDGRLDRCERSDTCPKSLEVNSANEYWAKAGSMLTTDTTGHDLDLDHTDSVRYYLLASLPHGAGTAAGICAQPQNPLGPDVVLRALLVDLDNWVSKGRDPPANQVPRRKDGTLVPALPQSGQGFPQNIPSVSPNPIVVYNGIHHTGDLWDFGPRFDDGILSVLPPKSLGTPYPVFVPKTDADGNDIAGVRLTDVSVPVATYTGWALRDESSTLPNPQQWDGCDASGQRIPFVKTKAARLAAGDPRLSLEERYKDHPTYVNLVTQAAQTLEQQGFMLDQDVQAAIATAQGASVP
jgi:Alpha/beta hydrolase domain